EVTLDQVHDAVRPATELGYVLLSELMRFLPIAFLEIADRGIERHSFLCGEIAAVDWNDRAGHEGRRRRTQENRRSRDVVGHAPTAEGRARDDRLVSHRLLPQRPRPLRFD